MFEFRSAHNLAKQVISVDFRRNFPYNEAVSYMVVYSLEIFGLSKQRPSWPLAGPFMTSSIFSSFLLAYRRHMMLVLVMVVHNAFVLQN